VGLTFSGYVAVVVGAFAGAALILGLIIFFSTLIRSNVMLLIIGMMMGYIASSAISLLNFFATAEGVFSYTMWGMGDFSGVSAGQLPFFCGILSVGLLLALLLMKPLNALLLGERYAGNLGINVRRVRVVLLISTGLLTAVTTAFCGPIAFIGLAVPHIARLLLGTSNHNFLLPVTMLCGAVIALLCNLISVLPGSAGVIPLNAITPVLGAPVIIYVIVNQRKIQYFH
jgi:iron complex transport system permease protein